jgi:hypothetical protein
MKHAYVAHRGFPRLHFRYVSPRRRWPSGAAGTDNRCMTLTEKQREEIRRNWVAPAGSEEEKKFLDAMLESGTLNEKEQKLVRHWRDGGNGYGMHNNVFWELGKERALGPVAHRRAMKRHADLPVNTWFVAYFVSQGKTQKDMEEKLGLTDDGIRYHMDKLRGLVRQEYGYEESESVNTEQIARWFLGL